MYYFAVMRAAEIILSEDERTALEGWVRATKTQRRTHWRARAGRLGHDGSPLSHLLEVLMYELDGHCALADCRGDSLDRIGSHVSCGEDAWTAGL